MSKKDKSQNAYLRAMGTIYWKNKKVFIAQDAFRFVSQIFLSLFPIFIGYIATARSDHKLLLVSILLLIGASILHTVLWNIADIIFAKKVNPAIYSIREIEFKYAWKRDYADFVKTSSGKSAATINRTYVSLESVYEAYVYQLFPILISIPAYLVILVISNPWTALAYVVFLIVMMFILRPFLNLIRKHRETLAYCESDEDARVFDSFSNFVNVLSFRTIKKERSAFKKGHIELTDAKVKFGMAVTIFWAVALLVNYYLYTTGKINFLDFIISLTILIEFTIQFWDFAEFYGFFVEKLAAYKTNYNFLFQGRNIVKEYYEDEIIETEVDTPNFEKSIIFTSFNFAYPDRPEKLVLQNINLTIAKGDKIGVVGKSGSGKSTLVKLLLGFYEYDKNTIRIDDKASLKEQLATLNCYVPQDTALFQQSIEYNIAYAKNVEVSHDEVVAAAKKAHAHEFIMSLKDGYDTLVGERGIKLSLGQRQRIALARAFLKDSQLLILDEATSSLDSKTESLVQESLEELWKNRTVVAVAHRLSTLNNVDRIIVIDNGEIVEQGTKTELLAMNGIFTELWNHQANGMIIEDDEDEIEDNEVIS